MGNVITVIIDFLAQFVRFFMATILRQLIQEVIQYLDGAVTVIRRGF